MMTSRQPPGRLTGGGQQFHSKYSGRHNGGQPCFTLERSAERAAKRVPDQRHHTEGDRLKEASFLSCLDYSGGAYVPPFPSQLLPHLHPATRGQGHPSGGGGGGGGGSGEGEGGERDRRGMGAVSLQSLARTGYTHADTLAPPPHHHYTPHPPPPAPPGKVQGSQLLAANKPSVPSLSAFKTTSTVTTTLPDCAAVTGTGSDLPLNGPLPALDDRGMSRKMVRRHSSPGAPPTTHSSSSFPRHPDNVRQPLSSREASRRHDNQPSPPMATAPPKAAFMATSERPSCHHLRPGRVPLIRGLKAPSPRHGTKKE
ncbi:uncharacterized protein LOC143276894 [Babylonia areolata]|uniref:uncharacterized protein LOC143276894 n=1 Tax=Babylonia areolata TaxID=304850 RepID=UPI003FD1607C